MKILDLITTIISIFLVFYYGFRHYLLDDSHQEWEKQDSAAKFAFYLFTSPIWLLVGLVELFDWIVDHKDKSEKKKS